MCDYLDIVFSRFFHLHELTTNQISNDLEIYLQKY